VLPYGLQPGIREICTLQTGGPFCLWPSVVEGKRNLAGVDLRRKLELCPSADWTRRQSRVSLRMNHLHECPAQAHTTQPRGSPLEMVNSCRYLVCMMTGSRRRQIHHAPMVIAASQWYLGTCNAAIRPSQSAKLVLGS
jgi:hypothetical protein